jgi:hypothetical protein
VKPVYSCLFVKFYGKFWSTNVAHLQVTDVIIPYFLDENNNTGISFPSKASLERILSLSHPLARKKITSTHVLTTTDKWGSKVPLLLSSPCAELCTQFSRNQKILFLD